MSLVIFEARSAIGHFRRPDTLGTHATYPFITRTALHGLIASVLGLDTLPDATRCGIRLLSPVASVTQELSMHGKTWTAGSGAESTFSRPTSIEILVNPSYRLFYQGELAEQLTGRLAHSHSQYHTYLGAAYCLTVPRFLRNVPDDELQEVTPGSGDEIEATTVVPSAAVQRLCSQPGRQYARVGGLLYEHLGGRRFRGTINLLYEVHGHSIRFQLVQPTDPRWRFVQVPDEGVVCLW